MRFRRYFLHRRGRDDVRIVQTGPYFSFLATVGSVLAPLFGIAMLWEFWVSMFEWHWADGGIFLMIYGFIFAVLYDRLPERAQVGFIQVTVTIALICVTPVLILAGAIAHG